MKKKLTAIFLCVALVAIAIVGASLAYFTDTESVTNTFTVGKVKIDLIESRFHREGNDNSGDTSIPDPTQTASGMKYVTDATRRSPMTRSRQMPRNTPNISANAAKTWFPAATLPSAPMWSTPAQMMLMSASV